MNISDLPQVQWGELSAPCESAPIDFSIAQSPRRWPYVDGAGHDNTGRDPIVVPLRLHFSDTMRGGKRWFTDEWPKWFPYALMDGAPRDFFHPLLGDFRAVVEKGHVEFTAKTRSGVVVDVQFTETVENPEVENLLLPAQVDPGPVAEVADVNMGAADIDYPDGMPEGMSFFDAWQSIKGQVHSAKTSVFGQINVMQSQVRSVIDDIESHDDPATNPVARSLVDLWDALETQKRDIERPLLRKIGNMQTSHATTLAAIAKDTGNSLAELMELNAELLREPMVRPGARVTYYAGKN